MPAAPLTHHEILGIVEPFARRGRHVDLAASRRAERTLVFKPVELAGGSAAAPALQAGLRLECRESGSFRLTRTLTRADGLQATVQAVGTDAGALLEKVETVAPEHQFRSAAGYAIARSYEFGSTVSVPPMPILCRGVARVDGLTLTLNVMEVRGTAGDLVLAAEPGGTPGETLDLPEDLLAVLGWNWARLVPNPSGWTSKLRLRGKGAARTRSAENALEAAARHLAAVLAEAPAAFHQRHLRARWGVVLRRAIPSLTAVALVVMALLLPRLVGEQRSGLMMALHYVPIAVLALSFSLQELARFEIPPWPRRPRAAAWRQRVSAA